MNKQIEVVLKPKRKAYWYGINHYAWAFVDRESEEVIRVIAVSEPHGFWTIEQKEVNAVRHFVDVDAAKNAVERLYLFEYEVTNFGE